jgi:predicted AAA+ superfamily ATPase
MKEFIKNQHSYLENKDIYQRTEYHQKLDALIQTRNVIILEGQRRVGKSSIIVSYLQGKKIDFKTVFYLNKELDSQDKISSVADVEKAFTTFINLYGEPTFIIIDEIQDIPHWEKFIRKYNAYKKYTIIITGSNSKLLSGELATYLTGRYFILEVFPFSYKEFLAFHSSQNTLQAFQKYCEF